MAQKYTDEQKAAVLARVPEIGIQEAAEEAGIPWKKVVKWEKKAAASQDTEEAVPEKKAKKQSKKARIAKMNLIFESGSGRQISLQAIAEKVPKGCDAAYVKIEENRIYWVKEEETGSEEIW